MKHPPARPDPEPAAVAPPLKRRGVLLGTGVAVAAGVAAAVASRTLQSASPEPAAAAKQDESGDGYRLSQHVLRYYETTRV